MGADPTAKRVPAVDTNADPVWEPVAIFDANWNNDGAGSSFATGVARQLYHAPSVFYSASMGLYGLSFGSGNRENLWDRSEQNGRFYTFLDDSDELDPADLPITEENLQPVIIGNPNLTEDVLFTRTAGRRGWYLGLDPDERIITNALALTGLTTFSAFQPETALTDAGGSALAEETCGEKKFENDVDNLCARAGFSRSFVVATTSGDALLADILGDPTRFQAVSTFVTTSFTEVGQLKEPQGGTGPSSDDLSEGELDMLEGLKDLFPSTCRFSNYRLDLKMVAADTHLQRIAPIPYASSTKTGRSIRDG
ncbi:MAG: hypothetical protein VYE73_13695 [Acidobacteriota bacterium]|nr:hypothetical protein [Acidobacteriota bacterium]